MEITDGWWWVTAGFDTTLLTADVEFVVKVLGVNVFMYGDRKWYRHHDFNFVREVT